MGKSIFLKPKKSRFLDEIMYCRKFANQLNNINCGVLL